MLKWPDVSREYEEEKGEEEIRRKKKEESVLKWPVVSRGKIEKNR